MEDIGDCNRGVTLGFLGDRPGGYTPTRQTRLRSEGSRPSLPAQKQSARLCLAATRHAVIARFL